MPFVLAAALLLSQMSPTQIAELRKYRYGKTAAQIEAMGFDAYGALFEKRTPNAGAGFMRGMASGVFVDAYRENTARRYGASLPPAARTRMLALDRQIRFVGVLFARNDWLFTGGNGFDPESDALAYAEAERQLYTLRSQEPDEARMRRRLTTYRAEIMERGRREEMFGAFGPASKGRAELKSNLGKIEGAVARAKGLCRTRGERAVLFDFVVEQAKARL